MPATASRKLRRILQILPEISDGRAHAIADVARRANVEPSELMSELQALADHYGAPAGFIEGVQIFVTADTVSVTSRTFLRPMGLTLNELCALELGLAVLRSERPPDETQLIERTGERLRKLIARLPQSNGNHGLDERALSGRAAELAPTDGLPHLDSVRKALRDRRKIRITYRRASAESPSTRIVRPYAVVPASGMWYAVAYCEASEGLRVFRMDRVEDASILSDRYEIPETFSVSDVLQEGRALQVESPATGMKVRYSPRIARWIAEREGVEPDPDGSVTIEHPLADADWGLRHVLQYGPEAEVLEPTALREEIRTRLSELRS